MHPYFTTLSDFLAMGKHGVYVWSCWGIVVIVFVGFILYSRWQRQILVKELTVRQIRRKGTNHNIQSHEVQ